jgi:hypothetical protein
MWNKEEEFTKLVEKWKVAEPWLDELSDIYAKQIAFKLEKIIFEAKYSGFSTKIDDERMEERRKEIRGQNESNK